MDRATLQQHLALAELHADQGRRLLSRQEALIASLDRDGHDTSGAIKVLHTLQASQTLHEEDVTRLIAELDR